MIAAQLEASQEARAHADELRLEEDRERARERASERASEGERERAREEHDRQEREARDKEREKENQEKLNQQQKQHACLLEQLAAKEREADTQEEAVERERASERELWQTKAREWETAKAQVTTEFILFVHKVEVFTLHYFAMLSDHMFSFSFSFCSFCLVFVRVWFMWPDASGARGKPAEIPVFNGRAACGGSGSAAASAGGAEELALEPNTNG